MALTTLEIRRPRHAEPRVWPSDRSDWREGLALVGNRGPKALRTITATWPAGTESDWRILLEAFEASGMGAGELNWINAPGGARTVRFLQMPAVMQSGTHFTISAEFEEILTPDN